MLNVEKEVPGRKNRIFPALPGDFFSRHCTRHSRHFTGINRQISLGTKLRALFPPGNEYIVQTTPVNLDETIFN